MKSILPDLLQKSVLCSKPGTVNMTEHAARRQSQGKAMCPSSKPTSHTVAHLHLSRSSPPLTLDHFLLTSCSFAVITVS